MCVFKIETAKERERERGKINVYILLHIYVDANKTMCPPQWNHGKYQLLFPPQSFHIIDLQALWPRLVHGKVNQRCGHPIPESSAPTYPHPKDKDNNYILLNTAYIVYNNFSKKDQNSLSIIVYQKRFKDCMLIWMYLHRMFTLREKNAARTQVKDTASHLKSAHDFTHMQLAARKTQAFARVDIVGYQILRHGHLKPRVVS